MKRLLATCLLGLAGLEACNEEVVEPAKLPPLPLSDPALPGPYRVGVTTLSTTSEGRTLPVEVWYPAAPDDDAPITDYPLAIGTLDLAIIPSGLGAVRDAAHDVIGAPHPTVVFSHGHSGFRTQSVSLMEHLASHGFVVAAPDHAGGSLLASNLSPPGELARLRPIDVSATLDLLLEESADTASSLYFSVDPARVGVAGHGHGGFSAFRIAGATMNAADVKLRCEDELVCDGWDSTVPSSQHDDRFIAALAQSPAAAFTFEPLAVNLAPIDVPVMLMGGSHDDVTPYDIECAPAFEALDSTAMLLHVKGAGHFTFSNVCALLDELGLEIGLLSSGCSEQDLEPADAQRIAAAYAAAFFQETLIGETPSALLEEASPRDELVLAFERKAAPEAWPEGEEPP